MDDMSWFLLGYVKGKKDGGGGTDNIKSLTVTENGTYSAPEGVDGYNPVEVNVTSSSSTSPIDTIKKYTKIAELDIFDGYKVVFLRNPDIEKPGYAGLMGAVYDSWSSGKYSYLSYVEYDTSIWGLLYHGDVVVCARRCCLLKGQNLYTNNYDGSLGSLYATGRYDNINIVSEPTYYPGTSKNFFSVDMTVSCDYVTNNIVEQTTETFSSEQNVRFTPHLECDFTELDLAGYTLEMQALLKLVSGL